MSDSANTSWARAFVDELARAGVREVVLAPGSRSTPLVMACARDDRLTVRVHLDERSAAFFALGVGRASDAPAVVITTSGTAVANVFPAVIEASLAAVPLIVLTADRPHRLRDADANQAVDQVRIFGTYPRAFFEVAPASESDAALSHLRGLAARSVAMASGPAAGPVHLNFPFEKPLEPAEGAESPGDAATTSASVGRPDGAPYVRIATGRIAASPSDIDGLADSLDSPRGVIVAGPSNQPDRLGASVLELAARTGFPVLADPLSGARYCASSGARRVSAYELFLRDARVAEALEPTMVLRVGAAPTSAALQEWLTRHAGVPQCVIDAEGRWKDHRAAASHYVEADAPSVLSTLVGRVAQSADDEWLRSWSSAESATLAVLTDDPGPPHEGTVLASVVAAVPVGASLFVSSSMPVRDLDAFAHPREGHMKVFANRGASGIDGIASTAFGVASQVAGPTVCVVGDVALFHDQNGLLWSREPDAPVVFVLIDNDGGGIFHMLPISEHEPHFTEFFATPHGLDLRHAAEMHGIECRDVAIGDIGGGVTAACEGGRTVLLRVRTNRSDNVARHRAIADEVARRTRAALGID